MHRRLILLPAISAFFRWLEELLTILNGPLVMVGSGIAIVDLLMGGGLITLVPQLLLVWAVSQALGVETQLLGTFTRVREAWARHEWPAVAAWAVLGAVVGYFAWQAGWTFAFINAEHLSETTALSRLGISPETWYGERAALAVGLVALSGLTRYVEHQERSVEDERARLEREVALEPLRQEVRARRALGAVGLGRQMLATATGRDVPDRPPTGGGSPATIASGRDSDEQADGTGRGVVPLKPDIRHAAALRQGRLRRARAAHLAQVVSWLQSDPDVTRGEIARRLRCSPSHAGRLKSEALGSLSIQLVPEQMAQ